MNLLDSRGVRKTMDSNRPRRRRASAEQLDRTADDRLLTMLYTVHGGAVRRFVSGHVVDVQHREDVVQETFVRAWKSIDQIDTTDGNPRSYPRVPPGWQV